MIKSKKILILESVKANQERIKEQFLNYNSQCIFVVAFDRDSFLKKINWFTYDVISSCTEINDISGLEAIIYIEENLILAPIIFTPESSETNTVIAKTIMPKADGVLLKENLTELPDILNEIVEQKGPQVAQKQALQQSLNRQKLMIQKLNSLITRTPQFEGKAEIESVLSSILSDDKNEK